MIERPGILAKRAAYQYRRRDILAYTSLRLYLRNQVSLRDRWAQEVATDLAVNQTLPVYNHILQFKQLDDLGKPDFRHIYMPGPNEIVAETALLAECADSPEAFQPPTGVYSYRLSTGTDTQGVFKYYLPEYRNRHRSIARACRQQPDAVVLYTDIRQFYPSVSIELAKKAWNLACQESQLKSEFQGLGTKILENYGTTTTSGGQSLLIGPMFRNYIES